MSATITQYVPGTAVTGGSWGDVPACAWTASGPVEIELTVHVELSADTVPSPRPTKIVGGGPHEVSVTSTSPVAVVVND